MCFCAIAVSCSTSTKLTVFATPGTEILTPNKNRLAVADGTGKAMFKISDDTYYAFLLSHTPSSNDYVPFALDYKYHNYGIVNPLLAALGKGVVIMGAGFEVAGIIALCTGSSEIGIGLLLGGVGGALVGCGIGGPADSRDKQLSHQYNYKYLSTQTTNQDLSLISPIFDVYSAQTMSSDQSGSTSAAKKKLNASSSEGTTASTKKLGSSASSKALKDNASKVEGTYVGSGSLSQSNSVIESYSNISVTIKKSGKDVVLVNVIDDGEQFFDSDEEYSVRKLSDGKYELIHKSVKTAKITIDTRNNLVYIHPRVNIEGDIYSLSIKAKKQ